MDQERRDTCWSCGCRNGHRWDCQNESTALNESQQEEADEMVDYNESHDSAREDRLARGMEGTGPR